ncbi:helix-turn-helix transcriptional regulator [Paenibacillus qinlingensis]|nr:helix-turn-helix transcriptional regulator [Paenibacillus qinlingensis]
MIFPLQLHAEFKDISSSVHWAKLHTTRNGYEYAERRIYDFELLYVKTGSIVAYLGKHRYPLKKGQMLFISSGISHYIQVETQPEAEFLGIHFDFFDELEILIDQDIIVDNETVDPQLFCKEPLIQGFEPLSLQPVIVPSPQMIELMEVIVDEFNERNPGYDVICKGLMGQIIVALFRAQFNMTQAAHTLYGESIIELTKWLSIHYGENCSNSSLAARVNLNEDYLAKQFKAVTGTSPNKYVQMLRHREAKRLLRESDYTVEYIGQIVGYDDLHYFSRIFHKWEGISPREYRKLSFIY